MLVLLIAHWNKKETSLQKVNCKNLNSKNYVIEWDICKIKRDWNSIVLYGKGDNLKKQYVYDSFFKKRGGKIDFFSY